GAEAFIVWTSPTTTRSARLVSTPVRSLQPSNKARHTTTEVTERSRMTPGPRGASCLRADSFKASHPPCQDRILTPGIGFSVTELFHFESAKDGKPRSIFLCVTSIWSDCPKGSGHTHNTLFAETQPKLQPALLRLSAMIS